MGEGKGEIVVMVVMGVGAKGGGLYGGMLGMVRERGSGKRWMRVQGVALLSSFGVLGNLFGVVGWMGMRGWRGLLTYRYGYVPRVSYG